MAKKDGEYVNINVDGKLARVQAKSDDGCLLHLELKSGGTATADSESPISFSVGDVVLIWPDTGLMKSAPSELWSDTESVAVVRLRHSDVTVIDEGARWRVVPTTDDPAYEPGNTVLVSHSGRVKRVLDVRPLRLIDVNPSEFDITRFREVKSSGPTFEDFGGMAKVVARAKELIEIPLQKAAKLLKIGARPIKGVLFTGAPGTGKTMLARIIAASAQATFYRISGPEILSKWYGESEPVLRQIFADAATQSSAIIFLDEIDSLAASRDHDSNGASQRVVAQLLTLMDGFNANVNVVVIAATNRLEVLDAALRRPGRFDWEVEFPEPTEVDRIAILHSSSKKIRKADDLPIDSVAKSADGWSAAELAAIWSEAALLTAVDDRSMITEEDLMEGFRRVHSQRQRKGPPLMSWFRKKPPELPAPATLPGDLREFVYLGSCSELQFTRDVIKAMS